MAGLVDESTYAIRYASLSVAGCARVRVRYAWRIRIPSISNRAIVLALARTSTSHVLALARARVTCMLTTTRPRQELTGVGLVPAYDRSIDRSRHEDASASDIGLACTFARARRNCEGPHDSHMKVQAGPTAFTRARCGCHLSSRTQTYDVPLRSAGGRRCHRRKRVHVPYARARKHTGAGCSGARMLAPHGCECRATRCALRTHSTRCNHPLTRTDTQLTHAHGPLGRGDRLNSRATHMSARAPGRRSNACETSRGLRATQRQLRSARTTATPAHTKTHTCHTHTPCNHRH